MNIDQTQLSEKDVCTVGELNNKPVDCENGNLQYLHANLHNYTIMYLLGLRELV